MPETRPTATVLRTGDRGPGVAEVRDRLTRVGLLPHPPADAEADVYDADVERAVRAFQQQRGLTADGLVGPATYRTLY
jgi:N-acetylmuramoyl-L-alanine amidase